MLLFAGSIAIQPSLAGHRHARSLRTWVLGVLTWLVGRTHGSSDKAFAVKMQSNPDSGRCDVPSGNTKSLA